MWCVLDGWWLWGVYLPWEGEEPLESLGDIRGIWRLREGLAAGDAGEKWPSRTCKKRRPGAPAGGIMTWNKSAGRGSRERE